MKNFFRSENNQNDQQKGIWELKDVLKNIPNMSNKLKFSHKNAHTYTYINIKQLKRKSIAFKCWLIDN